MITDKESIQMELLVLRCKRRDPEAFQQLVRIWERRLLYYIRRLVEDEQDAWDILQETWLNVIKGIAKLREPASLPTWLYRIARNGAVDHLRKKIKTRELFQGEEEVALPKEEAGNDFNFEDAHRVHEGLLRISLPHREVLTLHFLDDMSIAEIAEVLQVPPGTVKSRIYHAKKALKSVLENEE